MAVEFTGVRMFLVLLLAICLAYLSPLWQLAGLGLAHEQYTHTLLIPFITAYLMYLKRGELLRLGRHVSGVGIGILSVAAVVAVLGIVSASQLSRADSLSIIIFSFALACMGVFLVSFGPDAFRCVRFPLLFLLLMIPLPDAALAGVIRFLLWGSTEVTDLMFQLFNVTAFRHDATFILPNITIVIADECSGIRSTMALFLTALLAAHLFLAKTWTKVILLLAVVPLAIFKNGLRIVTLTQLAVNVDPGYLSGPLHQRGGFLFFSVTLAILGALLYVLSKWERPAKRPVPAGS